MVSLGGAFPKGSLLGAKSFETWLYLETFFFVMI